MKENKEIIEIFNKELKIYENYIFNEENYNKSIEDFYSGYIKSNEKIRFLLKDIEQQIYSGINIDLKDTYLELEKNLLKVTTKVFQNKKLYEYWKKRSENESGEEKAISNYYLNVFEDFGIHLSKDKKEKLKEINRKLLELKQLFSSNIINYRKENPVKIKKEDIGLPEVFFNNLIKENDKYIIPLNDIYYNQIMSNSSNRKFRELYYKQYLMTASVGEYSNQDIIKEIISLREEKYNITKNKFNNKFFDKYEDTLFFAENFLKKVKHIAAKEIIEVKDIAFKDDEISDLREWDYIYYKNKLIKKKFNISLENLKIYFPEDHVLNEIFDITKELFDIEVKNIGENKYALYKDEELLGEVKFDIYHRENKKGGAWVSTVNHPYKKNKKRVAGFCNLNANISKTEFLEKNVFEIKDIKILLHEFGHVIHNLSSNNKYTELAGTHSIERDFVELPSMLMEKLIEIPEIIQRFSKSALNDSKLNIETCNHISDYLKYQKGLFYLRQAQFAVFDLKVNNEQHDPLNLYHKIKEESNVIKYKINTDNFPNIFQHIFSGNYDSSYYSYLFSEVLAVDSMKELYSNNSFNKKRGKEFYDIILSNGSNEKAAKLYKEFKGSMPDINVFLDFINVSE